MSPGEPARLRCRTNMSANLESYVLFELAGSVYGLPSRGVQHIEMFELGFEPLLVEITPINIDSFPTAPGATPGLNDPV